MADLAIIVDTRSLVDAKKKLTDFQNQMGKTNSILGLSRALGGVEANVKELIAAQNKGQLSANSFKQGLLEQKKALVALGLSFSQAKQKVDQLAAALKSEQAVKAAAAAARDLARAQKEVGDAHERTRQRYVAGAAAQAQLKQAQRDLSAAYRAGIVNLDEYRQALILLNQQNLGNRRSTNNLGVAMQQTGYQVGDFVVQVQSGQNPMVAFGQQATQLVGVLYLLPPAILASTRSIFGLTLSVSALIMTLGIAIPILTAIGAAYMRMKKDSDVAGKASDSLDEKLKALSSTLEDYANILDAMKAGVSLDELFATRGIKDAAKDLAAAKASLKDFNDLVNSGPMGSYADIGERIFSLFGKGKQAEYDATVKAVIAAETRLGLLRQKEADTRASNFAESSLALTQELALLQAQEKYGVGSAQAVNAELAQELRIRLAGIDARVTSGELDKNAGEALKLQVERAAELAVQINANTLADERREASLARQVTYMALHLEYAERQARINAENDAAVQKIADAIANDAMSQERQLALSELRVGVLNKVAGAEEALAAKLAYYAREDHEAQLMKQDILGKNLIPQMALYDALVLQLKAEEALKLEMVAIEEVAANTAKFWADAYTQLNETKVAGSELAEEMYQAFLNGEKLYNIDLEDGVNAAALAAGVLAENLSISLSAALEMVKLQQGFKVYSGRGEGPQGVIKGQFVPDMAAYDAWLDSQKKGKGGGSKTEEDPIIAFQKQLDLQQALIGKTEEQKALLNALGVDYQSKYSPAVVSALETQITMTNILTEAEAKRKEALEEATRQQEQLADFIGNSMGDALMSIVDGTMSVKDAFKSMASDIIKELYRVLVVQQLVNAAKTAFGFADGGAFSGGSQVQAYANGGVVGGPTYFPMAGGKTGLMGEAGPEAIMPLKRGANGKLGVQMEGGGGSSIVVNQSFNFSANGDDSVKKIIAQAAPQIANMTKKSIMDDRRRGGQMKATFG